MNDLFLRACRGEKTERIPIWLMRQAGRSLPGYRKLRKKYGVLELAQTPELAAQVQKIQDARSSGKIPEQDNDGDDNLERDRLKTLLDFYKTGKTIADYDPGLGSEVA